MERGAGASCRGRSRRFRPAQYIRSGRDVRELTPRDGPAAGRTATVNYACIMCQTTEMTRLVKLLLVDVQWIAFVFTAIEVQCIL